MKKFTSILTMVLLAALPMVFTSCEEDDDDIAYRLDGVWYGTVASDYFYGRYGYETQYNDVMLEFFSDPYEYASGLGREVDYGYGGYISDVVRFRYTVRNGVIYMDYSDGTSVAIHNYRLYSNEVVGEFHDYDTGAYLASFELYRDGYDWEGRYRYYSKTHAATEWPELEPDTTQTK